MVVQGRPRPRVSDRTRLSARIVEEGGDVSGGCSSNRSRSTFKLKQATNRVPYRWTCQTMYRKSCMARWEHDGVCVRTILMFAVPRSPRNLYFSDDILCLTFDVARQCILAPRGWSRNLKVFGCATSTSLAPSIGKFRELCMVRSKYRHITPWRSGRCAGFVPAARTGRCESLFGHFSVHNNPFTPSHLGARVWRSLRH